MVKTVRERLFSLQDGEYRQFTANLSPTVNIDSIIGVRMPEVRKLAKELYKHPRIDEFLDDLPHRYFDENNLHAMILSELRDYDEVVRRLDAFLPYIDSWATCDSMRPKIFGKHLDRLNGEIERWMATSDIYTVRFAIEMRMNFYLDDAFKPEYLAPIAAIRSEEYYVNMMVAWFFATALAKQWDAVLPYLTDNRLSVWVHNKTIRKAIESFRITDEQKTLLRTLKREE